MKHTALFLAILTACAACGKSGSAGSSTGTAPSRTVSIQGLSLMLPLLDVNAPQDDVDTLKPFLRSGDVFVFPPNLYALAAEVKKGIPGLELGTGGTSKDPLLAGIAKIPADISHVTYDYEPGFTPEFSPDEATSISFFSALHSACAAAGKKLVIVPVWVYGKTWDWGKVAQSTDVLVLQVQNFQTGAAVPTELTPTSLGIDLEGVTRSVVGQVRAAAPSVRIYLQFDVIVTDNVENVVADIATVRGLGIDGLTLWYNPGLAGGESRLGILRQVLERLTR